MARLLLETNLSDDVRQRYDAPFDQAFPRRVPMGLRISARLDDATSEKLASLQQITGKNVTEVLTEALDHYYSVQVLQVSDGNRELLGLAGLFDGPANLSANYKDELTRALDKKIAGHR